jgi:phage shock protein A
LKVSKDMGNYAIMGRLMNLWQGFVALWVTDIEKKHPEIAYQNSIASMTAKYQKLKTAAGLIIARRDDIKGRYETATTSLKSVQSQLDAAVATNQDDLALVLIEKKDALSEAISGLEGELAQAVTDADQAKGSLLEIQGEIGKLKGEKDRMVAMLQSAEARIQIQSSLDGLSVDADVQALAGVREHIKGRVAEASLGAELRESDLDVRLKKLSQTAGTITARAKLDELKNAQAAAGTASAQKTL